MKILIVEDDENSRIFLARSLKAQGYSVNDAPNGVRALESADTFLPDIIISDIMMPEMDGFEFCRRIKAHDRLRTVPFIFYTATYVDKKDEKLALSLGASRFIVKPVELNDFLKVIKEVIEESIDLKLAVPDRILAADQELTGMHSDALARKLDKKLRELEKERTLLQESESKYRHLVENLRNEYFFCTRDTRGAFTYVSPAVENILGYSQDEFTRNCMAYMTDNPVNKALDGNTKCTLKGEDQRPYEVELFHKDGSRRTLEINQTPVFDENEEVSAIEAMARDVTEHKILQEQLLHSQKMEAVGQLTGGIAHDFNNILSAVIGYGHLLKLKTGEEEPLRKLVDQILAAADRGTSLTRSLLAFSRKGSPASRPVNINELIKDIEKLFSTLTGEHIKLRITFKPPHAAADGADLYVMADPGQIEQVLMNLVANSRDSMPEGGVLTIETDRVNVDDNFIRTHGFGTAGRYAVVSVSDTGTGIDEQIKEKLFEPFFTTKEKGKGTGLGLAIVYGIINQHNGYISVDSHVNNGTTFKIYLPVIESRTKTLAGKAEQTDSKAPQGTETILVAEDDDNVRHLITKILRKSGYKIIEASDGQEAIDNFLANQDKIRMIVTDMLMPRKNGKDLCDEIRAVNPGIKTIILSGYDDDLINKKQLIDAGITLITKPVYPNTLLLKVREVLDGQFPTH